MISASKVGGGLVKISSDGCMRFNIYLLYHILHNRLSLY